MPLLQARHAHKYMKHMKFFGFSLLFVYTAG